MKSYRESCGCRCNEREWLELCPPHRAEFQERHERAAREHRGEHNAKPDSTISEDWE